MLKKFLILIFVASPVFAQQNQTETSENQPSSEARSEESIKVKDAAQLKSQVNAESINSPKATVMKPEMKELPVDPAQPSTVNANPDLLTPPASSERGGFQVGEYGLFQKDMEKFKFTYSGENFTLANEYSEDGMDAVVTEHITGFEFAYSDDITTYFAQSYHTSFSEDVENELGDFRMGLKKNYGLVFSDVEFEWHSRVYLPFKENHRKVGKIQWRNYFTFVKPILKSNWNFLYELETRFWFYTEDELGQDASQFSNKIGINYKGFSFIDPLVYAFISNKFRHTGRKVDADKDELDWEDPRDYDDSIGLGFEAYIPITSFLGVIPVAEYEYNYSSNQDKSFEPFNPEDSIYLLIISLKL